MSVPPDWITLESLGTSTGEAQLQRIFDEWAGDRAGWRVAGAPEWLLRCRGPNRRRSFTARNYTAYRFVPDVLWDDPEFLVVELKCSPKYEPLALAEVLHHAWHLGQPAVSGRTSHGSPTPVLVASSDDGGWLRSALSYLFQNGLRGDAVRCLEASYFRSPDGSQFLWLEDTFAPWHPADGTPPVLPPGWSESETHWFRVAGCESWVGIREQEPPVRPSVPSAFALVSRVAGGADHLVYCWEHAEGQAHLVRDGTRLAPTRTPSCRRLT